MLYFLYTTTFILGAIIGSFLNVIAMRYHTGVGMGGRSFCFSCSHTLRWYDLIPILSFILLRGRCRYCKSKISPRYFFIEIVSGLLFLTLFFKFGIENLVTLPALLTLGFYLFVFSLLLVIALYDIQHKIIPNKLVYLFAAVSLLPALGVVGGGGLTVWALLAGPLLALPLALLWLVSRGAWIGLGDAKLVLGMGWLLGLSLGLAAVIISFWMGAVFGLFVILISRIKKLLPRTMQYTMKSEIPFGPFLIIGTFLVFIFTISFGDIQAMLTF